MGRTGTATGRGSLVSSSIALFIPCGMAISGQSIVVSRFADNIEFPSDAGAFGDLAACAKWTEFRVYLPPAAQCGLVERVESTALLVGLRCPRLEADGFFVRDVMPAAGAVDVFRRRRGRGGLIRLQFLAVTHQAEAVEDHD